MPSEKKELENIIVDVLKTIYDPEIPVDIYELGLIYEIRIDDAWNVHIMMTLTSPSCPVAESLPVEVEEKVLFQANAVYKVQVCIHNVLRFVAR